MTSRKHVALFVIVSAACIFAQLGVRGLNEPDEGRAASIAYEMNASREWLVPRLYDHAHFNKPPLLYWIMSFFYDIGGANEWMARLPAALSALGTLCLTLALARRLYGDPAMIPSGLILLTCPLFSVMTQVVDYNMLLTFWVTLALWSAVAWFQDGLRRHRGIFYLALAMSFLTKGPVGLVIVLLTLLPYRFLAGPAIVWRSLWSVPLVALFLVGSLAWFVAVAWKFPELWRFFIEGELYSRVLTTEHERYEPILYYAVILPLAVLPWLVPSANGFLKAWQAKRERAGAGALCSWILFPLLMFSLSSSKTPTYILPLLPAVAILAANALRISTRTFLVYSFGLLVFYESVLFLWPRWETQIGPLGTVRELAKVLDREAKPDDRIAMLERHPRGLSFYLKRPVSVPISKFEYQIESDAIRTRNKDFTDPAIVFNLFDSTQRTFIICSQRVAAERDRDGKNKPVQLYRDSNFVLISNQ